MNSIYEILDHLEIQYAIYKHPAVFTVVEANKIDRGIDGGKTKNLFLRNERKENYYLVVADAAHMVDMKELAMKLGERRLSFASPEKLQERLGLKPGSVSPFGLINDADKTIKVVVDRRLLEYKKLGFHPNVNTATLVISWEDFRKFLDWTKCLVKYVDL